MKKIRTLKKVISAALALLIVSCALSFFGGCDAEDPVRIHIRANSDADCDQAVKYIVRDEVVDLLTPALDNVTSKDEAYGVISSMTKDIKKTADRILSVCGFAYFARAYMSYEYFPDRDYGGKVYPAGYYDALIVELGAAKGGNWWCVAYPPLCFYGEDGSVEYASLIAEYLAMLG